MHCITWLLAFWIAGATHAQDAPLVSAPLLSTAPVEAADWACAPVVSGLRLTKTGQLATGQAEVAVAYTADDLHVRFHCPLPPGVEARGEARDRDGPVWSDDAVELFLDPDKTGERSFQFIANCRGSRYDGRDGDASWNGEWSAQSRIAPDGHSWTCHITVPFATLGRQAPPAGETWGANFCSDSVAWGEQSAWAHTPVRYDQPALFGALRFEPQAPGIGVEGVRDTAPGPGRLRVAFAPVADGTISLRARLTAGDTVTLDDTRRVALHRGRPQTVDLDFATSTAAPHVLDLSISDAQGQVLYATHVPMGIYPPVRLSLRSFPTPGLVQATVDARLLLRDSRPASAVLNVAGPEGEVLGEPLTIGLEGARGTADVDVSAVTGTVTVTAAVLDADGNELGVGEATVSRPPPRQWPHAAAIDTNRVLRPFQPIRTEGDGAEIWGRRLSYRGRLLPASITCLAEELLAAPIRFRLRTDEGPAVVQIPGATRTAGEQAVVREGGMAARGVSFSGTQTLEYDGCIKIELAITPQRPVDVEELSLEIPLRPKVARYLHACRADWANSRSQAIPAGGWESKFMPFLWVGDEDRGLAWFSETDEAFQVADSGAVLQIAPGDRETVLRVRIVDRPTQWTGPMKLVFGLQPTPVKPVPPRKARIWHGASYGMQNRVTGGGGHLALPAKGNIDLRRGTLETVVTLDFDPEEAAKTKTNQTLFHLAQPNGDQVYLFWAHPARGMWFYLGLGEGYPQTYPIHLTTHDLGWKRGETHHVAVTWGETTALYLDGKRVAESEPYDGWLSGPLEREQMAFGPDAGSDPAAWIVHAVQIASTPADAPRIAATAEEVAAAGPATRLRPTSDTLVLYHPRTATEGDKLPAPEVPDLVTAGGFSLQGGAMVGPDGVRTAAGKAKTLLDALKDNGVEVIVYHQSWTDDYGYPDTAHREELRALVEACHERGLKLLLYFGYGLGNLTPEMQTYHDEWTVWPFIFWGTGHPERQQFDAGCNRSLLPEFLLDGISKLLDDYAIDGVYLDGTTEPFGCINHYHGCGYQRDGQWKPTYPIWHTREFMRRLAALFQSRRADYVIDVHMSANMTIPTLAFCDSYWDGEQFEMYTHGQKDPRALLPLDSFRAEFMGRQWGLGAEFLVYEGRPFTLDEGLAVTLLHDVRVRPTGMGPRADLIYSIWRARDAFGVQDAEFLPYWSNGDMVAATPDRVYVSAHRRDDRGLLLVVSNLGGKGVKAKVTLSPALLDPAGAGLTCTDALTGEPVAMEDGKTLTTDLGPMGWRLVRVGAGE